MGMRTGFAVLGLAATILGTVPAQAADPAGPEGDRFFREKIRPVLEAECYRCHSSAAAKLRGGLLLDSREGLLRGGDTGPAVVPGNADKSLLIQAIRHEDGLEMPPKKPKLGAAIIADFETWIEQGAVGPAAGAGKSPWTRPAATGRSSP